MKWGEKKISAWPARPDALVERAAMLIGFVKCHRYPPAWATGEEIDLAVAAVRAEAKERRRLLIEHQTRMTRRRVVDGFNVGRVLIDTERTLGERWHARRNVRDRPAQIVAARRRLRELVLTVRALRAYWVEITDGG